MTQDGAPSPARRRAWPRVLLALVLVGLGGIGGLGWALAGGPLALPDRLAETAERRINAALDGPRVTLAGIDLTLEWGALPRLAMRNVAVFDAQGTEVARLNEVGARLDAMALLRGGFEPRSLRLSGAQATLRRGADGTFDLSFGGGLGASGTLVGVLDTIDRAFAAEALSGVATILAERLTITLEDARSGRVWQVSDARMDLTNGPEALELLVIAEIFNGTEDLAQAEFAFRSAKGSPEARFTARFENAAAADIAAQAPALAFLGVLDAPIAGTLDATMDADGRIAALSGKLEAGAGALRPDPGAVGVPFGGARARFGFDPARQMVELRDIFMDTEALRIRAEGQAYLRELAAGWPGALVGQFRATELRIAPEGLFESPLTLDGGAVDFRLRLDPFSVDIGQVVLTDGPRAFVGNGRISADGAGWHVAMDVGLNRIEPDALLAIWPVRVAAGTRTWLTQNLRAGQFYDLQAALRAGPGAPPRLSVSYKFRDATVSYLPHLPPVEGASGYASILNNAYAMVLENGHVTAPDGGSLDVTGTIIQIPDITAKPSRALLTLRGDGPVAAALSLLDLPPFELMKKGGTAPDVATGHAQLNAALGFDIVKVVRLEDLDFRVTGLLSDLRSDRLVPGRVLTADRLEMRADPEGLEIGGAVRVGLASANASWIKLFGPAHADISRVEGSVTLSQEFLTEFGIALPPGSVAGAGIGQAIIDLEKGRAPRFSLISDLNRMTLAVPVLGWSKPANVTGRLEVAGRLGDTPSIDALSLSAPGLSARGAVTLAQGGGLAEARFDQLRVGGWLDAPVTLVGRGPGTPAEVRIEGGTLDMRQAAGPGDGGDGSGGGPLRVALDRLVISDTLALTEFAGQFSTGGGLDGPFTARLNGGTGIRGQILPEDGQSAFRITSLNAGGALADAGTLGNLRGGTLDLVLRPVGRGVFDGVMQVSETRLVGASALTELLSAISVVGLLEQMNAEGIGIDRIEADFRLSPDTVTVYDASAVGPSLGITLDGRYDLRNRTMDMQGVLSPIYFVNGLGQVFTRRGEGVFGVNFSLTGPADTPRVQVNPLSMLAPGMFRDIFRRPPPERGTGEVGQ